MLEPLDVEPNVRYLDIIGEQLLLTDKVLFKGPIESISSSWPSTRSRPSSSLGENPRGCDGGGLKSRSAVANRSAGEGTGDSWLSCLHGT